jgi:hypothetical protein
MRRSIFFNHSFSFIIYFILCQNVKLYRAFLHKKKKINRILIRATKTTFTIKFSFKKYEYSHNLNS